MQLFYFEYSPRNPSQPGLIYGACPQVWKSIGFFLLLRGFFQPIPLSTLPNSSTHNPIVYFHLLATATSKNIFVKPSSQIPTISTRSKPPPFCHNHWLLHLFSQWTDGKKKKKNKNNLYGINKIYDQKPYPSFGPIYSVVDIGNNIENFIHDVYLSKGVHSCVSCGCYCHMILKEAHEAVNLHKTRPLILYTIASFFLPLVDCNMSYYATLCSLHQYGQGSAINVRNYQSLPILDTISMDFEAGFLRKMHAINSIIVGVRDTVPVMDL